MGKVRASAGGELAIATGTYVDELGRTRTSGSTHNEDAIVMPGTRRVPPAADVTHLRRVERHNAALQAENHELRVANGNLQSAKNSACARVAELETERRMMLEEIDRLRAAVAVSTEKSRDHQITGMFLSIDNSKLRDHIELISGQNTALAAGLIGTPMDPKAGKLVSPGSISDPAAAAYNQRLLELQAANVIPALPTNPLDRARYSAEDRVKCLLAKVGVLPDSKMEWGPCASIQGAMDATEPEHAAKLEELCKGWCGAGMEYDKAVKFFVDQSSERLARAEKTLRLTAVSYRP